MTAAADSVSRSVDKPGDRRQRLLDVQAAVDAPRVHHAWFPDELRIERRAERAASDAAAGAKSQAALVEALRAKGHRVRLTPRQGDAHTIHVRDGAYHGYADKRIAGKAVGY